MHPNTSDLPKPKYLINHSIFLKLEKTWYPIRTLALAHFSGGFDKYAKL
jgi:hypothetical protein